MNVDSTGDYIQSTYEYHYDGSFLQKETCTIYYIDQNRISFTSYEYNNLNLIKSSYSSGNCWSSPAFSTINYKYDNRGYILEIIYSDDNKHYKKIEFIYS